MNVSHDGDEFDFSLTGPWESHRHQTAGERDDPVQNAARVAKFVQRTLAQLVAVFDSEILSALPVCMLWLRDTIHRATVLNSAETLIANSGVLMNRAVTKTFEASGNLVVSHWAAVIAALDAAVDSHVPLLNSFGGPRCVTVLAQRQFPFVVPQPLIRRARSSLVILPPPMAASPAVADVGGVIQVLLLPDAPLLFSDKFSGLLLQQHWLRFKDPLAGAVADRLQLCREATTAATQSLNAPREDVPEGVAQLLGFLSSCGVGVVAVASIIAVLEVDPTGVPQKVLRNAFDSYCTAFGFTSRTQAIKALGVVREVVRASQDTRALTFQGMARREPGAVALKRKPDGEASAASSSSDENFDDAELLHRVERYCDAIADVRFAIEAHRDFTTTLHRSSSSRSGDPSTLIAPSNCTDCVLGNSKDDVMVECSAPVVHLIAQGRMLDLILAVEVKPETAGVALRFPTLFAVQTHARLKTASQRDGRKGGPLVTAAPLQSRGVHLGRCTAIATTANSALVLGVVAGWSDEALLARSLDLVSGWKVAQLKALLNPPDLSRTVNFRQLFEWRRRGRPRVLNHLEAIHDDDDDVPLVLQSWQADEVLAVYDTERDDDDDDTSVAVYLRSVSERETLRSRRQ